MNEPTLEEVLSLLAKREHAVTADAVVDRRFGRHQGRLLARSLDEPGRFAVFHFSRGSHGWAPGFVSYADEREARGTLEAPLAGEATTPRQAVAQPIEEADGLRGSLVVVRKGTPVAAKRVDAAERALGTRLPAGLRTFWQEHGAVALGESGLRVLSPERVVQELASWPDQLCAMWSWESDAFPLTHALECIRVAEHDDASSILFHPVEPDRLFALDRDGEEARDLGLGFVPALLAFSEAPKLIVLGTDEPLVRLAFEGDVPVEDVVAAIRTAVTLDRDEENEDGWEGCSAELRGVLTIDGDEEGCRVDLEVGASFPLSAARRALSRTTKALEALGLQRLS